MRAIAKRTDSVWLVTDEEGTDLPEHSRVLDLEQRKLFPRYNTQSILARGDWEDVEEDAQPDFDEMLLGIDVLDDKVRDDIHDPGVRVGTDAGRRSPESPEYVAWKIVSGPGSLKERKGRLEELLKQFPGDYGVISYFESLEDEREIRKAQGLDPDG
jgi:hypothetical protein